MVLDNVNEKEEKEEETNNEEESDESEEFALVDIGFESHARDLSDGSNLSRHQFGMNQRIDISTPPPELV
ncbi:MAG: hypothetical protein HN542_10790 [Flavobacteriales bacterium]|mgnify:FL=1|jgi:hypothetical protein|nr:hypothetical protein [Flavobacteriales bacterium]MBT3964071.1 hypothetical protein [Flavobacteriales bacterium]MBT4704425.1 hypothetical protein [Flavobacteriales bacterium]MBT4929464.1 hypothetical protein [Flavobacteriales bacterium]MBT5131920.1 hypothetical protein [Flavobacteriales bacterium]